MAGEAKNNVSQPPLTTPMVGKGGVLTKPWSIWFRDMYRRTAYKGDNAIDDNATKGEEALLALDATLQETIIEVNENTADIESNTTSLDTHISASQAHSSNGAIVGKNDLATALLVGLVKMSEAVNNALDSTVSVDADDVAAAPVAYDQTYTDTVVTLVNETKADVNTLVTDVNAAITQVNDLLAKMRTAGLLNV